MINAREKILSTIERQAQTIEIPENMFGDQWILASALQKAIRRGDVDKAIRAGAGLWYQDRRSFWRRVTVAVAEDIGIGNIDCAIQVWTAYEHSAWRQEFGDLRIGLYLISIMCRSVKSRLADELYMSLQTFPDFKRTKTIISKADHDKLAQVALNSERPLHTRALALWMLAPSRRFPSDYLPRRSGNPDLLIDILQELGVDLDLTHCCIDVMYRTQWPLALFLPLLSTFPQITAEPLEETRDPVWLSPDYEGVPYFALDRFTRLGQTAIRHLQKAVPELKPFTPEQVGMGLFAEEGGLLDRSLTSKTLRYYRAAGEAAELCATGLNLTAQTELRQCVKANADILAEIRHDQLGQYFYGSQRELSWEAAK